MRKLIVLPLLVLLAACTEQTAVGPDEDPGFVAAKGGKGKGGGGGGGGGDYLVQDLGTLGGSFSLARDISDEGHIVGVTRDDAVGKILATLWVPQVGDDYLPTLVRDLGSNYTGSWATAINKSGNVIVGDVNPDGYTSKPVRWALDDDEWVMELLTLPGSVRNGIAYDVNEEGVAVGWTGETATTAAATFWPATGDGYALLVPGGTTRSGAYGINDAGHIVGRYTSGGVQAVLWILGGETYQPCDLDHGDALYSGADAVSEMTDTQTIKILGSRHFGSGNENTISVWTLDLSNPNVRCPASTFQDIAGSGYLAHGINSNGVVVGQRLGGRSGPVLWTAVGELVELPVLKGNRGAAEAINNTGLVVGWGAVDKQVTHALLWKEKTPN